MFYAPVLFKTLGSDDSASLLNTVIVGAPAVLVSVQVWDYHCAPSEIRGTDASMAHARCLHNDVHAV